MNTLEISTANATTESPDRLRYALNTPMTLDSYITLSDLNVWYNWKNITQALNNNVMTYKVNGVSWGITLPDGSYSIKDINSYIHYKMEGNNHFDSTKKKDNDERYNINLYANNTYNRVSLKISGRYSISFNGGLATVLGASADTWYATTSNLPNVPKLEKVRSVQVHCNLVYNEYQSDSSLLYSFTPNSSFGSLLSITPRFARWKRTRIASENAVEVWLTNQDGQPLLLEDDWGINLLIADKNLIRI